jgi:glycosyltransferase involved in cell wall biosynthesis
MIRLAIVEQESQMGGVEYSTLYLAAALDRALYAPLVIAPVPGPLVENCARRSVPTQIAPRPQFRSASFRIGSRTLADPLAMLANPQRLVQASHYVERLLREYRTDLVLTKGLLTHFYAGLAARRLGIPCIWHVQDEVPARRALGLYLRTLQFAAQRLADAVIGDAASITRQLADHRHAYTVYNGIDTAEYAPDVAHGSLRADLGIPDGALLVGNLARLTDWKGQHVLIDAFNQVARVFPAAQLVLIGSPLFDNDQYERRLRAIAAAGPAAARIHFAGYRTDTAASIASLDIYVHPSLRKDTAPLALLSALAVGRPAIISDVPGMVEVVEPGESAVVVPAGDSAALASQLAVLLNQPERRAQLGANARADALRRFSIQAHTAAMTSIFEDVLSRRAAVPLAIERMHLPGRIAEE